MAQTNVKPNCQLGLESGLSRKQVAYVEVSREALLVWDESATPARAKRLSAWCPRGSDCEANNEQL